MRDQIITRIGELVGDGSQRLMRWDPAKRFIMIELMGLNPNSKSGKKYFDNIDIKDPSGLNLMSDAVLIEYFELIVRQWSKQM